MQICCLARGAVNWLRFKPRVNPFPHLNDRAAQTAEAAMIGNSLVRVAKEYQNI